VIAFAIHGGIAMMLIDEIDEIRRELRLIELAANAFDAGLFAEGDGFVVASAVTRVRERFKALEARK
jgi:hypothetical protein